MSLKGGPQLRARLKALRQVFKPIGKEWADDAARLMRPQVPVRTGRLRASFRRRNATQRKATVVGHYTAYFIDAGTKAHVVRPRKAKRLVFESGGRTIFAKKVNIGRVAARPFRTRAAREALRRNPLAASVIDAWNRAAGSGGGLR